MKVRLTIMTENDIPASRVLDTLGKDKVEETITDAWNIILTQLTLTSENNDRGFVEKCEFVGD